MSFGAASRPRLARALAVLASLAAVVAVQPAVGGGIDGPKPPSDLRLTGATQTTLSLAWKSSRGRGAAGYDVYLDGAQVGSTTSLAYDFGSLACTTQHVLGVAAFAASGDRSGVVTLTASTTACDGGGPSGPTADTSPPSAPTGLSVASATGTSVALAWSPSADDVGVAGYAVYVAGARVATTAAASYTASGLACGTTYALGVEAYDAAGNVSTRALLNAATTACAPPPEPVACDRYAAPDGSDAAAGTLAAPFRTPQRLADSLASGQTGCLRGGTYTVASGYVLDVRSGGTTVRSYPGEHAKLVGIVQVRNAAAGFTLSHLRFEGTGGANTVKIYAPDVVVEDSDVTNAWRGRSCMMLGSNAGYGQAARVVVRRNRFHECGDPANGNKDHAIYAQNVVDGEIVDNVFWNSAAYALELYPNAQRTRVAHNVVDGASPSVRGGFVFGGDTSYASNGNVVELNVITYAATYDITASWGGAVGSGNLARNNCVWGGTLGNVNTGAGGFTASGNVAAAPAFVDRASRDYRLAAGSPCLAVVGYDTAAKLAAP